MAARKESDQRYALFRKKLGNFLRSNSGFPVSGAALMGSRRKGVHTAQSDMDIIFAITKNPQKKNVYPELVEKLESGMNVQAKIGSSYNVIKIQKGPLKVDLVLRTEEEYREQKRKQKLEEL